MQSTHNVSVFQDDGGQQRPLRDAWFTIGLSDYAAFCQVVANSALHLDSAVHRNGRAAMETPDSMRYHAEALKSIQKRLDDPVAATSDGVIGAVSSFLCHAVRDIPLGKS
jgi:hypothetical protein